VIAPVKTMDESAAERIELDQGQALAHLEKLRSWGELERLLPQAISENEWPEPFDPEQTLYSSQFFSNNDKQSIERVALCTPNELATEHFVFEDRRLPELLFRYRARNYPDTLNVDEKAEWKEYRQHRLTNPDGGASITLSDYFDRIEQQRKVHADNPGKQDVLTELERYGQNLEQGLV